MTRPKHPRQAQSRDMMSFMPFNLDVGSSCPPDCFLASGNCVKGPTIYCTCVWYSQCKGKKAQFAFTRKCYRRGEGSKVSGSDQLSKCRILDFLIFFCERGRGLNE